MFVAFQLKNQYLYPIDIQNFEFSELIGSIWVDLINPTDYEYRLIYTILGDNLVKFLKFSNIHKTLYHLRDENVLCVRAFFLYEDPSGFINSVIISFVICDNRLYTFCDRNISILFCYQICIEQYPLVQGNVYMLLLTLFEISLDYLSDKMKVFYKNLEDLSLVVTNGLPICEYDGILSDLSWLERLGWKIRLSLLDIQRVIYFLINKVALPLSGYKGAKDIVTYIDFLLFHNESLFKKIHFLIQIIMNFISIEQNRIIKILSVIFLPPTLVASSYGMNFEFMPELRWSFGYPAAIILMVLSGIAPYIYFRYKKWL
ncbi:CorA family divalent cation transporter [Blochmannia endosymbiont of Polyrhachis (Hedomyrma) turneri]|uniref:CorA family divalent cation transporter n=1 Tax=Blochmannia endosymbiont of Polyrhachis (Hedomyrma) turneri TaxID=1505596 RepID=UPI00061A8806|nr:CorA family divalent cation transporter [Blochmannia endosymbiont of Polyrhachis (Hedomyrma) turneri]AKC60135.1 Magnesium transport protein CorA [Blochmannia endosymbiont of Polyrhachis (Hedomyrma) turneri]